MDDLSADPTTRIEIDGQHFSVDDDRDLVLLMGEIEEAARSGPNFVHIPNRRGSSSVIVGPRSKVVVTVDRSENAQAESLAPFAHREDWGN